MHATNLYALSWFYNREYKFDTYEEDLKAWLYTKVWEVRVEAESNI